MSQTIDQRVVEMRFDNKQFESGAKESLGTLDKLKSILDKGISSKSLDDISKSAKNVDISGISKGIETLQDRFSTLGIVGMEVIRNITDGLMGGLSKGIHAATDAIVSGGIKRAMNIENAHFQLQGLINDETEVQAVMQDAMDSVDGTAYAYDEAAKAASMFAASGLRSGEQMQMSLKAIAGTAATTNAEYSRVADIFTKIAGKGKVQAEELNQFASMGMNAAAAVTKYFNSVNDGTIEASEGVKSSIKDLTDGLEVSEADIRDWASDSKISFEMFTEAMGETFGDHAKDANKTFTGSMANIRAALARTGAMFVSPLVKQDGPFVQFFNAVRIKVNEFNKALGAANGIAGKFTNWINSMITSLTKVVEGFKVANTYTKKYIDGTEKTFADAHKKIVDYGNGVKQEITGDFYTPFDALSNIIEIIKNTLIGLGTVLKPIGSAFKDAFALKDGGNSIYKFLENLAKLSRTFKLSEKNSKNLHDAFKGLFDIIKMTINVASKLINSIFKPMNTEASNLGDSIFDLIGNFGRFLSKIADTINKSKKLTKVFESIGEVVRKVASGIKDLLSKVIEFASGGIDALSTGLDDILKKTENMISPIEFLKNVGLTVFNGLKNLLAPLANGFKNLIKGIYDVLASTNPLEAFVAFINGMFTIGITNSIGKLINTFTTTMINTVLASISNLLLTLSGMFAQFSNLEALTGQIKALGEALLMLAGACFILASINTDDLDRAVKVLGELAIGLGAAFLALNKFSKAKFSFVFLKKTGNIGFFQSMGNEILKLAAAITILAIAVKLLSSTDPERLKTGMMAVTGLLIELTSVAIILNKTGTDKKITSVGISLLAISASILVLTAAIKSISELDMTAIVKGLVTIGGLLLELGLFTKFTNEKDINGTAIGLLALSASLKILVGVIRDLGNMPIEQLAKGILSIGASLAIMVIALNKVSDKGVKSKALAAIEMAASMWIIAQSLLPLANTEPAKLTAAVLALNGSLAAMMLVLNNIKGIKGAKEKAFAAIEMAASMYIIAQSLLPLASTEPVKLTAAVLALNGSLAAMMLVLNNIKGIKGAKEKAFAAIEMAAAMWIIAQSLVPLTTVEPEKLAAAVIAMSAVLFAMVGAIKILSNMSGTGIAGSAAAILMAGSLWIIAQSLVPLTTVDTDKLGYAVLAISLMLAEMTAALAILSNTSPLALASSAAAILMAASLWIIAQSLLPLTTVDTDKLGYAVMAIGLMLAEMTAALVILSNGAPIAIAGGAAAVLMAASMWIIAQSLLPLASVDTDGLKAAVIAMGLILAEMTLALVVLSNGAPVAIAGGAAAILLAASMWIIAQSLLPLTTVDTDGLKAAVIAIGLMLAEMTAALVILSNGAPLAISGGAAAILMAGSLWVVAQALVKLKDLKPEEINGAIASLSKAMLAMGGIMAVIGALAPLIATASAALLVASLSLAASVAVLSPAIVKLKDTILVMENVNPNSFKKSLTLIGTAITVLAKSLKNFGIFAVNGSAALLGISIGVSKLAPALALLSTVSGDRIESTMIALSNGFSAFGKSLKDFGFFSGIGATVLDALSLGIKNMAPALMMLSRIDGEVLSSTMETLAGGFKAFGEALEATPFWGSGMRANGIGALIDNIAKLTEALPPFIEIPSASAKTALETLGTAFKSFGESLEATPFWGSTDRAKGIGALIENIPKLTEALPPFVDLVVNNSSNVNTALTTLGNGFKAFGEALAAAPMFNSEDRAAGIATLIDKLTTFKEGIEAFIGVSYGKFDTITTKLGEAFTKFGTSLQMTPMFNSTDRAGGITALVDHLDEFAEGVKKFVEIDADSNTLESILTTIGTALKDFGTAVYYSPLFNTEGRALAITTIVDSLDLLAEAVTTLSAVSDSGAVACEILSTLGTTMKDFGSAVKGTPFWNTEGRADAVVSIVTAMDTLADAVLKLQTLSAEQISAILGSLSTGITSLGGALDTFTDDISLKAQSFNGVSDSIKSWLTISPATLTSITTAFVNFIDSLKLISGFSEGEIANFAVELETLGKTGVAKFAEAFSQGSANVTKVVTTMLNNIVTLMRNKYKDYTTAGSTSGKNYADALRRQTEPARQAATSLVNAAVSALTSAYGRFYGAGVQSANNYAQGLSTGVSAATAAAASMAQAAASNMDPKDDNGVSLFYKSGANAATGFVNGIKSKLSDAKAAGREIANAAKEAAAKALQEKSPSRVMYGIGSYAGEGFVLGLQSWLDKSSGAGESLAKAVNDAVSDFEMDDIVITPLVDLSNVMESADLINAMFNSALSSTSSRTSAVIASANAANAYNSNSNIQNGQPQYGNTYNFVQNNNSPKALSRVDIYRDTKNLMKQYREAVEAI